MNPRDLIATARSLVGLGRRRPSQADLRRAVSTAYYAMFHCLAGMAADLLMGRRRSEAWHQTYRALEHGRAKSACRNRQAMQGFPPEIRDFAGAFVILQDARHQADYALEGRYDKWDVFDAIGRAEDAIEKIERADAWHRRSFAAHVLFRRRPSQGGANMNEQRIREIAEAAFKRHFGEVGIFRVNVKPRLDHEGDPVVDVKIIYDGKYEQLNGEGLLRAQTEIVSKVWWEVEDSPGFPMVRFIAKSSIGRRDPATV